MTVTDVSSQQSAAQPGGPLSGLATSTLITTGLLILVGGVVRVTGHGLGYRYHEYAPMLAPRSPDVLRAGMIHSVEPGVYDRSFGGIRIEDDVLVTDAGAEVLGPAAAELWTA